MKRKALITGITGQDGAYLAEFLLKKGYEVHGIKRRSSLFNTDRIDHLYQDPHEKDQCFILHHGDMTDSSSLIKIIKQVQPDEIYNLAAQSHVQVSFEEPEYTTNSDALGTLRILEAIRILKLEQKVHFYQASTSELFGKVQETPQTETTPFYPRSPYAVAKLYAYWITVNYREAYGIYACNGILFNHECITIDTPLITRVNNLINICTPDELVPLRRKGKNIQLNELSGIDIWDGKNWTVLQAITATKRDKNNKDHNLLAIQARTGIVSTTAHHHALLSTSQKIRTDHLKLGDELLIAERLPTGSCWTRITPEMAEFLGMLAADGYVPSNNIIQFTNNNISLRERISELWSRLFLGNSRCDESLSGCADNKVGQVYLSGVAKHVAWIRQQLYNKAGYKRVPALIINADLTIQANFLQGYYLRDDLKSAKENSIKTNSILLAQGLYYLYYLQGNVIPVYLAQKNGKNYYQLNISTAYSNEQSESHLQKNPQELHKVTPIFIEDNEWVFDLATESGHFVAGVGSIILHNSPLRGETFVTRKITRALARIKLGLQDCLYLGNMDAKRDWGHAKDYVEMQWLMLQQEQPEDFVIASGKQYSVRDFVNLAAAELGININWQGSGIDEKGFDDSGKNIVSVDPRYFRPTEVESLLGDPTKAKEKLGWEPRISFAELVKEMVLEDLKLAKRDMLCQTEGFQTFTRHES